jgi:hypothetical protein
LEVFDDAAPFRELYKKANIESTMPGSNRIVGQTRLDIFYPPAGKSVRIAGILSPVKTAGRNLA